MVHDDARLSSTGRLVKVPVPASSSTTVTRVKQPTEWFKVVLDIELLFVYHTHLKEAGLPSVHWYSCGQEGKVLLCSGWVWSAPSTRVRPIQKSPSAIPPPLSAPPTAPERSFWRWGGRRVEWGEDRKREGDEEDQVPVSPAAGSRCLSAQWGSRCWAEILHPSRRPDAPPWMQHDLKCRENMQSCSRDAVDHLNTPFDLGDKDRGLSDSCCLSSHPN